MGEEDATDLPQALDTIDSMSHVTKLDGASIYSRRLHAPPTRRRACIRSSRVRGQELNVVQALRVVRILRAPMKIYGVSYGQ